MPVPRVHGAEVILPRQLPEIPGLEERLRGSEASASGRPYQRAEQAYRLAEPETDPEEVETVRQPYMLPDEDCERLKRSEMTAVRMLLAHLSSAKYAQEDLQDRLECIPNGRMRMRLVPHLHPSSRSPHHRLNRSSSTKNGKPSISAYVR